MKRKNLKLITLTAMLILLSNPLSSFAHSGRTDSNGGHRDNNNVSGLGSYHYHHGMEAHLHPNGVCPYSSNSTTSNNSTSANEEKAYKEQLEKDTGYDQGYNDALSEKSNNPSSSNSNYVEGYSLGYSKGVQALNDEKDSVKETAKNTGYNDGYSGNDNKSSSYSGKHIEIYKDQYNLSYKEGLNKRTEEITTIKANAAALGLDDGYNKINREKFDCTENYMNVFLESYKASYNEGLKNLDADILKYSNNAYISAFKNNTIDENTYTNDYIKTEVLNSYKEASNIFNDFLKDAPMLGESLEIFSTYAKENDKIQIGTDNIDIDTFISISDKSKRKVTDINLFINAINKKGYTKEVASTLIESFLKKDFIDSYSIKSSYQRTNDEYTYDIYNLKRTNKISKSAPRNFTIITVSKNDMVNEIKILKKEPRDIKSYKKI